MDIAIVHDIVLLLFSIVMAIPLNLLLQAIGYWLADRDFERRHNNHGKKR